MSSNEEIIQKINQLKEKVSKIVKEIQFLKRNLETSQISLEDFKAKKDPLQEELRGILQQIAQFKKQAQIQVVPTAREVPQAPQVPLIPQVPQTPHIPQEPQPPPIPQEEISKTDQVIQHETQIAEEAEQIMYYFQAEFEDSITKASIYLSITLQHHFLVGVDFTDYPKRPNLSIPPAVIQLFNNNFNEFLSAIPSYLNWDSNNPKRIYELIWEIETVLINKFQADVKTVEAKSEVYIEKAQELLERLISETKDKLKMKNVPAVVELYQRIIEVAYDIKEEKTARIYEQKLDKVLKALN